MRVGVVRGWSGVLCAGVLGLVVLAAAAHGADAPSAATKPSPLQVLREGAVTKLTDLAQWCAKNSAKSAGVAALEEAKLLAPDFPAIATTATTLDSAGDDGKEALIARQREQAYDAAAVLLDRLAAQPHDAADAQFDTYRMVATDLNPRTHIGNLAAWIREAQKAERWEAAAKFYALALAHDLNGIVAKRYADIEPKLVEKKALPGPAAEAVAKLIAADQCLSAAALLQHLAVIDASGVAGGAYAAAHEALRKDQFMIRLPDSPMIAFVSLPKKWDGTRKWPVLVIYSAADGGFAGLAKWYRSSVGDVPYIMVAPVVFSDVNAVDEKIYGKLYPKEVYASFAGSHTADPRRLAFDIPGSIAVIKSVAQYLSGEERVYVTGASGGGNPTYGLILHAPRLIAAAAPSCPNFYSGDAVGAVRNDGCGPICQFLAEKDQYNEKINGSPGIMPQSDQVMALLKNLGYRVDRVVVPNVGHGYNMPQVIEFFEKVRAEREKQAASTTKPKSN